MRWTIEHEIAAPITAVEAGLRHPSLASLLAKHMRGIRSVEELERREHGSVLETARRYKPSVAPPSWARGVTPEMAQWVERTRWDSRARAGRFVIEPNVPPEWSKLVTAEGVYRLEARGPQRTARIVEGVLELRVAVVGGLAERFIVAVVRQAFDGEAAALSLVSGAHDGARAPAA